MGLRRWITGKAEPDGPPTDAVTDLVNDLGRRGRIGEVEAELAKLSYDHLNTRSRVSWHAMMIASAFRRGDRATALERALRAEKLFPDEPEILFALGQEYESVGEIGEMLRCFARAGFPAVSGRHVLAEARYAYLHGELEAGLGFLAPLLECYFALKIADDMFLHIRNIPFSSVTFGAATCLHVLRGDHEGARRLLARAAAGLSDTDLSYLGPLVEAHERKDPGIAARSIQSKRASHLSQPALGGFQAVELACWAARMETSLDAARAGLERIIIRDTDHQWMHDVRTLALAEAEHRFGNGAAELELLKKFVSRQPLLLEPEWLITFGFVEYQERVRLEFWLRMTGRPS
jgi:tetratricopeptide (TPR) repeat protein